MKEDIEEEAGKHQQKARQQQQSKEKDKEGKRRLDLVRYKMLTLQQVEKKV